jgi:type I restriction enzyme S subunit
MSLPRYSKYKNSGVQWLGMVPSHWTVMSIKRLSPVQRGASPRPIDDPKYFDGDGDYSWVRIADVSASDGVLRTTTQRMSQLGASLSVKIAPGELFVSIAGTVGKPCISAIKACIHDGFVYFPHLKIAPKFLYRIFEAGTCYGGLGKFGTQLNLNTDTIGSICVAVPPEEELKKILGFLDREIGKIDALIAEHEKLIALLVEKRHATISHAVTRGLDPEVRKKESGVEWLGEVPAHWDLMPLKRAVVLQRGHDLPSDERFEGNIPVISSGGISGFHNKPITDSPTVVTGRYGTIGEFTYVEESCWPLNTALYAVEMHGNCVKYIWYMLQSLKHIFVLNSLKSAVPGVDRNDIHPVTICLAPLAEQFRISAFLDVETAKIDSLKAESERTIALLKERRSAVIAAAVTGQIDVRGAVSLAAVESLEAIAA